MTEPTLHVLESAPKDGPQDPREVLKAVDNYRGGIGAAALAIRKYRAAASAWHGKPEARPALTVTQKGFRVVAEAVEQELKSA